VPARWLLALDGVSAAARAQLETAAERLGLSARGYHRTLRVARTIADNDGEETVRESAETEALHYRQPASNSAP